MKRKLAYLLAMTLSIGMLLTGCDNSSKNEETETSSSNSTEESSEELVDITELYKKAEFEALNFADYVTLGDYSNIISLEEADYVVSEEDIQEAIDYYREVYGTTEEVTGRAVQDGDIVNIDYVGKIDGVAFEGGTASGYDLSIGSGTFIDGFEDGLIGAEIGETRDVTTKFPDSYPQNQDMAGKEAIFTVTVNSISEVVMAEYNDEFVEEITGGEYTTVDEFNQDIVAALNVEKKNEVLGNFCSKLIEASEFTDAVSELVEAEYEDAIAYYESYASAYGYSLEDFLVLMGIESEEKFREDLETEVDTVIKTQIVLYAYGDAIGWELSDEMAKTGAEELIKLYGYETVEEFLTDAGAEVVREEVYGLLISEKIIETYQKK